ncbi:GNAT family N-acetyltransferase [Streptomyces sp. NPDC003042]
MPLPVSPVLLAGHGFILREWGNADLPAMVELFDEPDIADRTPLSSPFDTRAARDYLEMIHRTRAEGQRLHLAITTDGLKPLGEVLLNLSRGTMGYAVGTAHRGQRLALRAAQLVTDYAHQILELPRVLLEIEADNAPSIAVARDLSSASPTTSQNESKGKAGLSSCTSGPTTPQHALTTDTLLAPHSARQSARSALRQFPDLIAARGPELVTIDAKDRMPSTHSDRYAISTATLTAGLLFTATHDPTPLFYVFGDMKVLTPAETQHYTTHIRLHRSGAWALVSTQRAHEFQAVFGLPAALAACTRGMLGAPMWLGGVGSAVSPFVGAPELAPVRRWWHLSGMALRRLGGRSRPDTRTQFGSSVYA